MTKNVVVVLLLPMVGISLFPSVKEYKGKRGVLFVSVSVFVFVCNISDSSVFSGNLV